jgi:competence protein ComEA
MAQETIAEKVDLNSCSASELMKAAGISIFTANEIVAFRKTHGKFTSVDDLKQVPKIANAILDRIRPHVKV